MPHNALSFRLTLLPREMLRYTATPGSSDEAAVFITLELFTGERKRGMRGKTPAWPDGDWKLGFL